MRLSEAFFGLRFYEQQKNVRAALAYSIFEAGDEGFDVGYAERVIELEAQ
jgi:hypothetical protein